MSGRNRLPFTASQWQELEHQALIFKYMISGMPIPPDLLFTVKRSLDSSLSSSLVLHQPQHVGWNCFQMGFGRKIDPEPGRCRRTDGKKWRCSKEAYPDSKYCERHMHRGRNRSRKPVEVTTTTATNVANSSTTPTLTIPISSITKNPNSPILFNSPNTTSLSLSSMPSDTHHALHYQPKHPCYSAYHVHHPSLYPHSSSSRPPDTTSHFLLDRGPYSHPDKDYRYGHGMKQEVDEHAFFSEASGAMRSYSDSSMDDSWQLTPLTIGSSMTDLKQRACSGLQSGYSYLEIQGLSTDTSKHPKQDRHGYSLDGNVKSEMGVERNDEPLKVMHHFIDEWPPGNQDSWLHSKNQLSNPSTVSTTHLSISMPNSSHDFFRTHNDK